MATDPPGFIRAGEHLWSPSERELYNMSAFENPIGTGDELRFSSHRYHFWVIPMVKAIDRDSFNEPRRPWHTGKARRPRYWAVAQTNSTQGPAALWDNLWHFPTQAKAIEKAKELAHHDKVMDLLEVE